MDKKEELKGLIKEAVIEEMPKDELEKVMKAADENKEATAKLFEENKELKAKYDDMQGKIIKLSQNTGVQKYVFKGYDVNNPSRNFKVDCPKEMGDEVAAYMVKALTSANTGAYAVPVEYSNSLLGLAELTSVALSKARVISVGTSSIKFPGKGTRATVDAQAFGTANAGAATTLAQLTFTIDKRVGSYEVIYNDILADENFDVVGDWVEPVMAEAIGQNFDGEMFNGTEFTTSVSDTSNGVTASGVAGIAAAITYANLVSTAYAVELERGVQPEWFLPRGAMKDIVALVGSSNDHPIFQPVPIAGAAAGTLLGYPINIVPQIDNTPDDGAIRVAFGDPKRYIIALRQGMVFQVNPYASMKEGMTQFIMYARADGNVEDTNAWATISRAD